MKRRFSEELSLVNAFRRTVPVDVELLAQSLGIEVVAMNLDDNTSGMIERTSRGNFRIVVNDNHAFTRQRFTIAHELGHYFSHRHLIGDGILDDRAYRSAAEGQYRNTAIGRRQETEANQFAANLLMPWDAIQKLQKETGINDPAEVARRIGVSEQAYCIRMGIPYEKPKLFA